MSLTCITCKIMEHIVCSQIGRHLDHNNILHPNQHGFRKGLSCETQLVDTIHELAYSINQKTQTDVIFLDFSKAFDKVSHDKLLHKIRYSGIGGKTNTWISAFLCSRSQQVVVNGQTSQSAGVLSGVPQGSVLGPMLFLMYINDIAEGVTSQMRMFADDSIVYRHIHTPADHFTLASDLNKLLSWAKTWQMDFNVSKCAVLSVTTKRNISTYNYFMGSQQIPRIDNQDYLGITINTKLSWQPHINKVQNKASKTLGLLKRTLHATPPQVRQTAYDVLVRPTLEFATCAWAPHTKTGIQTIGRVQRSAARFVTGDYRRTSNVSDMCTNLMWNSLYTRRRIRDATMFFKIHHGLMHISLPVIMTTADARTRRQHKHKLRTLPATCTPYQQSFYVRCIPLWNALTELTEEAVTASTTEVFQRAAIPVI